MKMTARLHLGAYGNNVQELLAALYNVPQDATYDVSVQKGDRPYNSDTYTITFSWET